MRNPGHTDYVYGYFDPSSYHLFYVGKGRGSRKAAHLKGSDSKAKTRTINAIRRAGLTPKIKVIAAGLTEREALLVESAFIWALGHQLTNEVAGSLSEMFRPIHSLHQHLAGFDTRSGVYLVNATDGPTRCWADCRKYGFLSAGGGLNWKRQIERLSPGDVVVAYLNKRGYVGVGIVQKGAVPVLDFHYKGRPLSPAMLAQPGLLARGKDAKTSEYLAKVKWLKALQPGQSHYQSHAGLYAGIGQAVASLARQPKTQRYVEKVFRVNLERLANAG